MFILRGSFAMNKMSQDEACGTILLKTRRHRRFSGLLRILIILPFCQLKRFRGIQLQIAVFILRKTQI